MIWNKACLCEPISEKLQRKCLKIGSYITQFEEIKEMISDLFYQN